MEGNGEVSDIWTVVNSSLYFGITGGNFKHWCNVSWPCQGYAHSVQQKSNAKNVPSPESELYSCHHSSNHS